MCGIAGIYSLRPPEAFRSAVERIVADQHRRGPDFQAVEIISGQRAGVALGHNRLAIIDLSPAGNQPMWDADRRLCMVFNGEIYNYVELRAELQAMGHRFISASDSEVILESFKRWGTEAFGRWNGMFALALFDTRDERLWLVRDRFGVKPLYYVADGDSLHFASTGGTIAQLLGLAPNLAYVSCGVRYAVYDHTEAAPYERMKALAPGHWLEVGPNGSGGLTALRQPYYDLNARTAALVGSLASVSIDQAADSVAEVLDDSVRIRLRSDVPVAVSLSGGLDSCTIAAVAAGYPQENLHGFTFGDPRDRHSEGPLAAELGRQAHIDVTYVWPSNAEVCRAYAETLDAQAGPFPGASIVAQYLVFQAARAAGFKVLLGGQGGDEAFMGYRKFQVFRLRNLIARKRYPEALGFAISLLPTFFADRWRWGSSWIARNRYLRRSGMTTVLRLRDSEMDMGYRPAEPLRGRQILDITQTSLPTLLRYEDSNSMGNSIESRLPFLDYRVVELGLALPEALKLRHGYGKWIVRRAMAARIPEAIRTARYKKGFTVQQSRWIDEGLGALLRKMLHDQSSCTGRWLPLDAKIDEVFSNEQLKGRPAAFAEATTLLWLANAVNHQAP